MAAAMRGYKLLLVLGTVLLLGVIGWRLFSSSYPRDVRAICEAESRSGALVAKEPVKVVNWMKSNVDTPEGVALVTDLSQKRKGDGAVELAGEAKKLKIPSCPLVDAYTKVQVDGDYKSDIARLCSGLEFPNLQTQSDDDRMKRLRDWVATRAQSPKTAPLVHEIEQLPPADRGKRLQSEAAANDKFLCEVATILDKPRPLASLTGPQARYHDPQITGNLKQEVLDKAMADALPKIKKCYTDALAAKPDLQGRIVMKLTIGEKGEVKNAMEGAGALPDAGAVQCVQKVFEALQLGPQLGPPSTVFVPIDFTPN
jgi:hypothetical protein